MIPLKSLLGGHPSICLGSKYWVVKGEKEEEEEEEEKEKRP